MFTSNSDLLPALEKDGAAAAATGRPLLSAPEAHRIQPSGPSKIAERRGEPLYKCEGSAEFRTEGFEVRTWARVTDLSRTGCYVEMQATSPLNTAVTLMIEVNGLRLHLKGDVKTSHRMQGMGIEVTEIPDTDVPQLEEIIGQLANAVSETPEPTPSGSPDLDY
jgi:PilZ domain